MVKGCVTVPIDPGQLHATLRICVVVTPSTPSGPAELLLLRDQLDSRVYIGCVVDTAGIVQRWVEIWVQDLESIQEWSLSHRTPISNIMMDENWLRMQAAFSQFDAPSVIHTGWEASNPPPVLIDITKAIPVLAQTTVSTKPLALCTDDLLLQTHGLPAYSTSLHRFLYQSGENTEPQFVQVLPPSPIVKPAVAMTTSGGVDSSKLAFNPGAGRLLVREFSSIDFESMIDMLADGEPPELDPMRDPAGEWQKVREVLDDHSPDGRLLAAHLGQNAVMLEYLHLRLHLIADAVRQVKTWTVNTDRPLLNLNAGSFAIRFANPGAGLPLLWTARALLRTPGNAVEREIPGSDFVYYQSVGFTSSAVYNPSLNSDTSGSGSVRITGVRASTASAIVIELKLVTQERIVTTSDALVLIRLTVQNRRADLHAKFQEDATLAPGEYRLRTIEQQYSPEVLAAMRADTGALIANVTFEVVPLLASPCDLYALGVLAIRSLLTNRRLSLPEALDRMISFSHHLARQGSGSVTPADVEKLFASESRWYEWLGPQQLNNAGLTAAQAFDVVPMKLWNSLLVTIARMLSGISPVSEFQNLGYTAAGAAHRVFDQTSQQFNHLLHRTRSLLVVDWHSNRELSRVIRRSARTSKSVGR